MINTYYTIQHKDAWDTATHNGYLEGNHEYSISGFDSSYKWLMQQMVKRNIAGYKKEYPVWLWTKRPDLRFGGFLERGQEGVLLEVCIDSSRVLISDFEAWHYVLNDWYLDLLSEDNIIITKEDSWERIFDIELLKESPEFGDFIELQGTAGKVYLNEIKLIKKFIAR